MRKLRHKEVKLKVTGIGKIMTPLKMTDSEGLATEYVNCCDKRDFTDVIEWSTMRLNPEASKWAQSRPCKRRCGPAPCEPATTGLKTRTVSPRTEKPSNQICP